MDNPTVSRLHTAIDTCNSAKIRAAPFTPVLDDSH
ncbi:MAG: hypothetical protein KME23_21375 [Goleter apudmare HA4340-LM2]|nr:hypothetical protein [Goleter apudmare HA4340-LM2]